MMTVPRFFHGFISVVLLLGCVHQVQAGALERLFAPKAKLWSFWDRHHEGVTGKLDHMPWHDFLQKNVHPGQDGINRVDYAHVTREDRKRLDDYIHYLTQRRIREYTRDEQLAYWINLYNAATLRVVLQHYPVETILDIDISPGLFARGPWGKKILAIEGQEVSLNDIEHRILRPLWKDARLHYALNCASLGCPNLQKTAFTAENTERLLDSAARQYVNHPRGASVLDGRLVVSSIYNWFRGDFGDSPQSVIHHLRRYASPELAKQLESIHRIRDDRYDWALNDVAVVPQK